MSAPCSRAAAGVTLVELLVALAIGSVLISAGLRVFAHGRTAYRAVESITTVQETARYALAALAYDIELAGFWGLTNRATGIDGRRSRPLRPPLEVANDCGDDWAIDLDAALSATNNRYDWSCGPYANRASPAADTLTVRRVDVVPAANEEPGRLYLRSTRSGRGLLYRAPAPATLESATSATHPLVTRGYYVSETSSASTPTNRIPSLRIKRLSHTATGPRVVDEEVYLGIEDMQIALGIDADRRGAPGFDVVDRYVDPESPALAGARVLAVRVWLLARSFEREPGFTASPARAYADRSVAALDDGYRRVLVSTTVYARNTP